MVDFPGSRPDPTAIGDVAAPSFARLPDPATLFAGRAARFERLAAESPLGPYLAFLGGLARAQAAILADLPEPALPDAESLARARAYAMPPLDRGRFAVDGTVAATFARLFEAAADVVKPPPAADALDRVRAADAAALAGIAGNVLADAIVVETLAEHVYVAAALQVHFARLAARLDAGALVPVGDGACPACGGPPAVSLVVGWQGAHGTRFCACPLCATLWHVVRVKCALCNSTKGIGYQEIEGGPGTVKAETCDACGCYVKILHQHADPALEPIADDVASLGLDLKMREGPYRRGGVDPFLVGY